MTDLRRAGYGLSVWVRNSLIRSSWSVGRWDQESGGGRTSGVVRTEEHVVDQNEDELERIIPG